MASEGSFLKRMEEYGFLTRIYDRLPEEFTAVFEIARILEAEDSELRKRLEPAFRLPTLDETPVKDAVDLFQPEVVTGEEYEADFIRNRRDIARIYSWQFMLPDEVFDQRLAERTLWMPVSKAPKILPIQEVGDSFSFDSRKQKVFVLFDTSSSMRAHHRIHLAKAVLVYFLERNKEDLGYVSLRTFDDHVGDLHTAIDAESYNALIRHILRLTHLGNGTVLQKALLAAIDEIEHTEHLAGAEILIITDGAVALDEPLIRSRLDANTKIHCVKIGHAQIFASDKQIDDLIAVGKVGNAKLLADLISQEAELKRMIEHTSVPDKRHQLESTLKGIRTTLQNKKREFAEEYKELYGHELQRLANVYIEIEDIDDISLFCATDEAIADIEMLVRQIEEDAEQFFTPDMMKRAAVLHDHVSFLLKYEKDPALRETLQQLDERLRQLLREGLELDNPLSDVGGKPMDGSQHVALPMSDEDIRDLHFLLDSDGGFGSTQLRLLLRFMIRFTIKAVKRVFRRAA
ncbi:MAG: VWA domain-containing protein [Bacteroidetes bacterium]|nr:VWA domain-containing protein [Bacteroidota bacterium]